MNRIRALLIVGVGIVAGLVATMGASWYVDRQQENQQAKLMREKLMQEKPRLSDVVVANREVSPGEKLDERSLRVIPWPASSVPSSALRRSEEAQGRIATEKLVEGEPVLKTKLAPEGAVPGLSALIQSGMRAVTVRVNEMVAVDGFIVPGSLVDVLATIDLDRTKSGTRTITRMVLQNIRVLAVDKTIKRKDKGGKEGKKVSYATLLATPEQAERLALAAMRGEILLSLRNNLDQQTISTAGITPLELVMGEKKNPPQVKTAKAKKLLKRKPKWTIEVIRGAKRSIKEFGS